LYLGREFVRQKDAGHDILTAIARDRVKNRRLAARARYPAPAVGLPPSYRFATKALLLRYITGGDVRLLQPTD